MDELARLQKALLIDRPSRWPQRGATAFRLHKLLAAAIHRATKLAGTGDKEGEAWVAYFVEHFPSGGNDEADARLLWKDWRTALLKTDAPGPGVAVTHGQSHARDVNGGNASACLRAVVASARSAATDRPRRSPEPAKRVLTGA